MLTFKIQESKDYLAQGRPLVGIYNKSDMQQGTEKYAMSFFL